MKMKGFRRLLYDRSKDIMTEKEEPIILSNGNEEAE